MLHTHQGHAHRAHERIRVPDDLYARPGFASTAVYFEGLAEKERRDPDRRTRLLEMARFYRSLVNHSRHARRIQKQAKMQAWL
jgi:hypothetical protein